MEGGNRQIYVKVDVVRVMLGFFFWAQKEAALKHKLVVWFSFVTNFQNRLLNVYYHAILAYTVTNVSKNKYSTIIPSEPLSIF